MSLKSMAVFLAVCLVAAVMTGCGSISIGSKTENGPDLAVQAAAAKLTAAPEKWENVDADEMGVKHFFSNEGVGYPAKNRVIVWLKRVFPERASQKEIISLADIDCREERYRTHRMIVVGRDNAVVTSAKLSEWLEIYGGSPESDIMHKLCAEAAKVK